MQHKDVHMGQAAAAGVQLNNTDNFCGSLTTSSPDIDI